jgi:hypothetical protein
VMCDVVCTLASSRPPALSSVVISKKWRRLLFPNALVPLITNQNTILLFEKVYMFKLVGCC